MKNYVLASIVAILGAMAAGCGSSTANCDGLQAGVIHSCGEIDGTCPAPFAEVASCSTTDVLGTCNGVSGDSTGTVYLYSTGGITVAVAQAMCTVSLGGTWKAQ